MSLAYDKTFQIEILNEYASGVFGKFIRGLFNQEIDIFDKERTDTKYTSLYEEIVEHLNKDLFKLNSEELETTFIYWKQMDVLIESFNLE